MNEYKEIDKMKYFAVFLMTVILFFSGIFIGNYISGQKLDQLSDIETKLRLETLGAEVQYQILIGNPCQFVNSTPLTEDLYDLSEKLDYLEGIFGEDDETVLSLKEQYSLLQVRHWLYTKKTNEQCGTENPIILYFYSNEGDCPKCEEQGFVLTYLRKNNPDLRVYSFDLNIENPALKTIKEIFEVQRAPTLIVGSVVYSEFKSRSEMENILYG